MGGTVMKLSNLKEVDEILDELKSLKKSLSKLKVDDARARIIIYTYYSSYPIYTLPESFNEVAIIWIENRIKELEAKIEEL